MWRTEERLSGKHKSNDEAAEGSTGKCGTIKQQKHKKKCLIHMQRENDS